MPQKKGGTATKSRVSKKITAPGKSGVRMGNPSGGRTGLKQTNGVIYEEFDAKLAGANAIRAFREMTDNDPIVGAMFFAIEMFMRRVTWFVDANTEDTDKENANKNAAFLRECQNDMSHTFADFISEVMSFLTYGWAWTETLYKIRSADVDDEGNQASKYNDGKIGWRKFEIRSQDSWERWDFDDEGGLRGMFQRAAPDYELKWIPIRKSMLFRTTVKKNNPEGRSVLRNAYRPWYFKKRIEEIEGIGVERDMAGLPFAEVPAEMMREDASQADKDTLASIVELVKNVRHDEQEGVVWPQSYDENGNKLYQFSLMSSGGTRAFSTDTIITRYESRIAMTTLQDFLLLGNDSQGSFAMATSKTGMFQSSLSTFLDVIQDVLNDYEVPRLFRLNGIKGPYPKFRHDEVQKPALADVATFVAALAGAGAQLFPDVDLENHFRRMAQLPTREEKDGAQEKEEKLREHNLDAQIEGAKMGIENQRLGLEGQKAALKNPQSPQVSGKQPGSVPGAPTKTTGPVKSKLPPQQRRRTAAVNAGNNTVGKRRVRIVKKKTKHPAAYLMENERINQNKKKYYGTVHKFKAAEWTHPNGHPRCLRCGDEERIGGMCNKEATPAQQKAFTRKLQKEFAS